MLKGLRRSRKYHNEPRARYVDRGYRRQEIFCIAKVVDII